MRASLDTNVIIHLYKAELQRVLFDVLTMEFSYMSRSGMWSLKTTEEMCLKRLMLIFC